MPSELCNIILREVAKLPNLHIIGSSDDYEDLTINGMRFGSGNEVYVGFDNRVASRITGREGIVSSRRLVEPRTFLRIPYETVAPLATLDDIKKALSEVPEIGEPIAHDENFLVYERAKPNIPDHIQIHGDLPESLPAWLRAIDIVIVGRGSYLGTASNWVGSLYPGTQKSNSFNINTDFSRVHARAHGEKFHTLNPGRDVSYSVLKQDGTSAGIDIFSP